MNYSWKDINECSSTPSNDNKHTWSGGSLTNQYSQMSEVWSLNLNIFYNYIYIYIYIYMCQFGISI